MFPYYLRIKHFCCFIYIYLKKAIDFIKGTILSSKKAPRVEKVWELLLYGNHDIYASKPV